jgi:hypothetical protein
MKLPILNLDKYDRLQQCEKVTEEYQEFVNADNWTEHILEGIDVIQSMLGYLQKQVPDIDDLQRYFQIHNEKLASRKWDTDGHIELKFHYK